MSRTFEPRAGFTVQAYQFALDPTSEQAAALRSHCGAQRKAYNWGLARVTANLGQRAAERSYGVPEDELTPSVNWSAYSLRKQWNQAKLRTHESTRKLARRLDNDTARILKATVSYRRGRWFVSFQAEVQRDQPQPATRGGTVGIDLGVKDLAVLSTGETIPNPKHLEAAQRKLRRVQRQASRRWLPGKRPDEQSHRWHRRQDRIRRVQHDVANARADGLHKLSTRLVSEFDTIVIEDLHVAGMLRNRSLARAIADVGMGELRRQIDYKTTWHGRTLATADRWFPSSKTCSGCGAVKAKLRLSERTYHCGECGLVLDRDYNAARNLANLVEAAGGTSTESCAGTENTPAGNPGKTTTPPGVPGNGYRHGKTTPSVAKAA